MMFTGIKEIQIMRLTLPKVGIVIDSHHHSIRKFLPSDTTVLYRSRMATFNTSSISQTQILLFIQAKIARRDPTNWINIFIDINKMLILT